MEVLWRKSTATVAEIAAALPRHLGLAYNTVLTTARILEDKGYLRHAKMKGSRAFLYTPIISRDQVSRSATRSLLRRFFGNSAEALVLNLIDREVLTEKELRRIHAILEEDAQ
jgi:predicted transcriptional regulator